MDTQSLSKIIILVTILVASGPIAAYVSSADAPSSPVIECTRDVANVTTGEGYLSVKQSSSPCAFLTKSSGHYFVLQTDVLNLGANDTLKIEPMEADPKLITISGPFDPGYLIITVEQPKLTFIYANSTDDSQVLLKFFQIPDIPIPISGDKNNDLVMRFIGQNGNSPLKQSFKIVKSIADPVYIEHFSGSKSFSHQLIDKTNGVFQIESDASAKVTLRVSPVMGKCSGYHESQKEESFELDVPDSSIVSIDQYKCVNIFKTKMPVPAHFDIDFKNFIEMVDTADELLVNDGSQSLRVTETNYKYYKELIPNISFKSQDLVVVYDSPQKINRRPIPFKLLVHSRAYGGIVDTFDYKFDLPKEGSVFYSLRVPSGGPENVALEFNKFDGADIKIYNRQNKIISFDRGVSSAIMAFSKPDDDVTVEFSVKSKISGTINYKAGNDCGGTLFDSYGTISIRHSNETCYWFLGAKSKVLNFNFIDLQGTGSLEIYKVKQEKPLFSRKNISSTDVLPPIVLNEMAYLKIELAATLSSFDASLLPLAESRVSSTSSFQTNMTSIGYPISYSWSDLSEEIPIDSKNKNLLLSVSDLDLRDGEKMTVSVNGSGVDILPDNVPIDFALDTHGANVKILRATSSDFGFRRGYKIVTTEFHQIIYAELGKNVITTPKNLTSFLLKVPAPPGKRISYEITFPKSDVHDYELQVIDSRSLMGRMMPTEEMLTGSTTSNVLQVALRSTREKVYVPEVTVKYGQVPCNKTVDHFCDGSTRCVPAEKLCKGVSYCSDGSDLRIPCSSGPAPPPKVIESGVGKVTVFILSVLMFTIGVLSALYGPDLYKSFEARYRSGHYTTFQSTE